MQDCKDKINRAREYLYKYPFWKNLIRMKEDDIINASGDSDEGMPRGTDTSNLTESKAMELIDDDELQDIRKKVKRVEKCIDYLEYRNEIYKEIVILKYFKRDLGDKEIYNKLGLSESTFYRRNSELLKIVSKFV